MDRDLRNNTLISNIAGNFVRAGQHRPLVSPTGAVLKAQETSLANSLMESKVKRMAAEDAATAKELVLKEQQVQEVIAIRDEIAQGLAPEAAIQRLERLGEPGKEAKDNLIAAMSRTRGNTTFQQSQADREAKLKQDKINEARAVADQRMQETTFAERNNPAPPGIYAPSNLKKLAMELQELRDGGAAADDPLVVAYEAKIAGTEIDTSNITQDEIDVWGKVMTLTGKMPSLGRGKSSTKVRLAIAKSAARQALGSDADGIPDDEEKTPTEAAFSMLRQATDTKSIQTSLNFLDKQTSAMGSFVENIGLQVDKVGELAEDLKTFDARILNVPLRAVRGRIAGSALQAKYDMYLTEIEGEIGKLATGSVSSIAELSATAQEKWAKIHDKNLSIEDMLSLLEETENAAGMRYQSVKNQLGRTRKRMINRTTPGPAAGEPVGAFPVEIKSDADYNSLPSGAEFIAPDGSRRRKP